MKCRSKDSTIKKELKYLWVVSLQVTVLRYLSQNSVIWTCREWCSFEWHVFCKTALCVSRITPKYCYVYCCSISAPWIPFIVYRFVL